MIWLLQTLEPILSEVRSTKNLCIQVRDEYIKFILEKNDNETVHDYMVRFKANLKALELFG